MKKKEVIIRLQLLERGVVGVRCLWGICKCPCVELELDSAQDDLGVGAPM